MNPNSNKQRKRGPVGLILAAVLLVGLVVFQGLTGSDSANRSAFPAPGGVGVPGEVGAPSSTEAESADRSDSAIQGLASAPSAPRGVIKRIRTGDDPPPPWAEHKWLEKVSWETALSWWPDRPLFRATHLQRPGWEELVFVGTQGGGTKGSPRSSSAGVDVWYQYPPNGVYTKSFIGALGSGAYAVFVVFYPTGTTPPWTSGEELKGTGTLVTVRGRPAKMIEKHEGDRTNVSWRAVRWEQTVEGGVIQWEISNHPDLYSKDETIEFIDRLEEIN